MNKILIVDDNEDLLSELKEAFEGAGYDVAVSSDGVSALEVAKSNFPDLVLLDLNLPRKSGFEVASALKKQKRLSNVPIIAMTGHYTEEERKRAINACGIRKCLTKPMDMEEMFKEVENILGEG